MGENIKLTYKDFRVGPVIPVFQKLLQHDKYPIKLMYTITKIGKKLDQAQAEYQKLFEKMVRRHALKDDKGELLPRKSKDGKEIPGSFEIGKEQEAAWKAEVKEFDDIAVEIPYLKLSTAAIVASGLAFSPQELLILEPFLNYDDEESQAAEKAAASAPVVSSAEAAEMVKPPKKPALAEAPPSPAVN